MKVGESDLIMSSGERRHFKSKAKRARFERVAEAVKHGLRPRKSRKGRKSKR